jgi:hypothetical protein
MVVTDSRLGGPNHAASCALRGSQEQLLSSELQMQLREQKQSQKKPKHSNSAQQ